MLVPLNVRSLCNFSVNNLCCFPCWFWGRALVPTKKVSDVVLAENVIGYILIFRMFPLLFWMRGIMWKPSFSIRDADQRRGSPVADQRYTLNVMRVSAWSGLNRITANKVLCFTI